MTNMGLERALRQLGIDFRRARVGDRYVLEMLKQTGGQLGGETSGHLLVLDKTTTGDGLISALQVLCVLVESNQSLAELVSDMPRFPQVLLNIRTGGGPINLDGSGPIRSAVEDAEGRLGANGRVLVRASGTEPVVRVMVEGEEESQVAGLAEELARRIEQVAAG
jgi:phosphoglucosamine mutase